jgi:hypothetical protein
VLSQAANLAHAKRLLRRRFFEDVMKLKAVGGDGHMPGFPSLAYSLSRECP